jgi:hypothetical protein
MLAPVDAPFAEILSPAALEFVAKLQRAFDARRRELLARRSKLQADLDRGWTPDFLPETWDVRRGDWKVVPLAPDLLDRRVEITGPVDRKMVINALNSGAKMFMADFEDAHSPTWAGTLEGQVNLLDAVRGLIDYTVRTPSSAERRRGRLVAATEQVHAERKRCYGSPRMTGELNSRGHACTEGTVAGLATPRTACRWPATSWAANFEPPGPRVARGADATYIPPADGRLHLAVVEDLFSRTIVA